MFVMPQNYSPNPDRAGVQHRSQVCGSKLITYASAIFNLYLEEIKHLVGHRPLIQIEQQPRFTSLSSNESPSLLLLVLSQSLSLLM